MSLPTSTTQLLLGIALADGRSFDNFVPGPNQEVVAALRRLGDDDEPRRLHLYGSAGTGKSHLLQACCEFVGRGGSGVAYVPLSQWRTLNPSMLTGLGEGDLVCLDGVDWIAGSWEWEEAIFRLFNTLEQAGGRLVAAGRKPPSRAGYGLADLQSRLASTTLYRLNALDDASRRAALQLRARERGFELPDSVAAFVLERLPRDMHTLFAFLDCLDRGSMAAKRPVTVALARSLLDSGA